MVKKENTVRSDYVPHGSKGHAAILGIREAKADDSLQIDGWALIDVTAWGPMATQDYLKEVLRQKVNTLKAGAPPIPQSVDSLGENYAPPMFNPA